MGQKVNPHGLRVGVIKDWDSKWYAEADFADNLIEDYEIRTYLKKKLYSTGVSKIEIERSSDRVRVNVYTAKPGLVIGKGGAEIEKVKAEVQKMTDKKLFMDVKDVKRPDKDAQLVAENIAAQLENRVSFRRAMKSCNGSNVTQKKNDNGEVVSKQTAGTNQDNNSSNNSITNTTNDSNNDNSLCSLSETSLTEYPTSSLIFSGKDKP